MIFFDDDFVLQSVGVNARPQKRLEMQQVSPKLVYELSCLVLSDEKHFAFET